MAARTFLGRELYRDMKIKSFLDMASLDCDEA